MNVYAQAKKIEVSSRSYSLIVDGHICKTDWNIMFDYSLGKDIRIEYPDGSKVSIFEPTFDHENKIVFAQTIQSAVQPWEETMAHVLEGITKEKTFSAAEMIEEQITQLLVRLADFKGRFPEEPDTQQTIESMRNDLTFIRGAVRKVLEV